MKRGLVIVGAGGMGREVLNWAEDIAADGAGWDVRGFLDDNTAALDAYQIDYPVLGTPSGYVLSNDDVFVCAIGDPKTRLQISRLLVQRGAKFVTLVHPGAVIGKRVQLGCGVVVCPHVCVTCDVRIGDFVYLNVKATVGHDASLDEGCVLSGHSDVTGGALLGKGVFMGSHSCVHPRIRVGDYARIGAGTAVIRDVPAGFTAVGVPAKKFPPTIPSVQMLGTVSKNYGEGAFFGSPS